MSSNKSLILSEKVEANLSDAVADLKLLVKELASGNTSHMEVEKLMLQAEKVELEAAKLEFEAGRANLQIRELRHQTAISLLEKGKPNLTAGVDCLAIKARDAENKLDQCCKDKKAMQDDKAKPVMSHHIVIYDKVFFDVEIDGMRAGYIVIKLDYDTTPLTAEKFRVLCAGERGIDPYYKGKMLHGTNHGTSIICPGAEMYGSHFPPENISKKHVPPGAVYLAYTFDGKVYSNQFFISTANNRVYYGHCVVFGHVIGGMDLLMEMKTSSSVGSVIECGQVSYKEM